MSRKSAAIEFEAAEEENVLRFDAAPEFMTHPDDDGMDDVSSRVKEAQERIVRLRQEQEELERQQKRFEELQQKQERFAKGKRDLLEKLTRSATQLDRDLYDAQKWVEELSLTRDNFGTHLETLRSLQPEKWHRGQIHEELENALAAIDDAEDDYTKGLRRIATCRRADTPSPLQAETSKISDAPAAFTSADDDLMSWVRRGFAFTLPLIGTLLLGLILAKLMF